MSRLSPSSRGLHLLVRFRFYVSGSRSLVQTPSYSLFSWGPIPWLLGAEIFPLRARAKGMALSTSTNWICNFIIAFITPPLFSALGGGYYFLLLGFTAISGIFVWFVYPETAGKTLEDLGEVFGDSDVAVRMEHAATSSGERGLASGTAGPPQMATVAEPAQATASVGLGISDASVDPAATSEITLTEPALDDVTKKS